MDVSENGGTPKSSILIGFSIINHPFWGTPLFGNTHIYLTIFCQPPTKSRLGKTRDHDRPRRHPSDSLQEPSVCLRILRIPPGKTCNVQRDYAKRGSANRCVTTRPDPLRRWRESKKKRGKAHKYFQPLSMSEKTSENTKRTPGLWSCFGVLVRNMW